MKPKKITLFIGLTFALLAGLSVVFSFVNPEQTTLHFPTLAQALDLSSDDLYAIESVSSSPLYEEETDLSFDECEEIGDVAQSLAMASPQGTSTTTSTTTTTTTTTTTFEAVVDSTQSYLALQKFREALKECDSAAIRVVHYGDSQIEEDRITMVIRRKLQDRFGGGGVGLIPLVQTVPSRSVRQTLTMNGQVMARGQGPKRYLAFGSKSGRRPESNLYGMMAQTAVMDTALVEGSDRVSLHVMPSGNERGPQHYFSKIRTWTSGNIRVSHSVVKDSTTQATIHFSGMGDVYGISLETPTGVIVDNIPLRGCSGTIFTSINRTQLTDFFASTRTRLIIMQFGGNSVPYIKTTKNVSNYVAQIRRQIRYMQSCAPDASILFIGPSDMVTKINGVKTTYPLLPLLDNELHRLALEEGAAYWSLFEAMGGAGGMAKWKEKEWAGPDLIHFTRSGAKHAGDMLAEWILNNVQE